MHMIATPAIEQFIQMTASRRNTSSDGRKRKETYRERFPRSPSDSAPCWCHLHTRTQTNHSGVQNVLPRLYGTASQPGHSQHSQLANTCNPCQWGQRPTGSTRQRPRAPTKDHALKQARKHATRHRKQQQRKRTSARRHVAEAVRRRRDRRQQVCTIPGKPKDEERWPKRLRIGCTPTQQRLSRSETIRTTRRQNASTMGSHQRRDEHNVGSCATRKSTTKGRNSAPSPCTGASSLAGIVYLAFGFRDVSHD